MQLCKFVWINIKKYIYHTKCLLPVLCPTTRGDLCCSVAFTVEVAQDEVEAIAELSILFALS